MKNWKHYLSKELITYMGNKRSLINEIEAQIKNIKNEMSADTISFSDPFSGSGVVSRMAKKHAHTIYSNDLEYYSYIFNSAYLSNLSSKKITELDEIFKNVNNKIKKHPILNGYFRETYSPQNDKKIKPGDRTFYTNSNAEYIDSAIHHIKNAPKWSQNYLIASLIMEASIKVNTAGIFKGFYKNTKTKIGQFGGNGRNALKRIKGNIQISVPYLIKTSSKIHVFNKEASDFIQDIPLVDITYLDPPYNQHPYGSNYFMLNLIAKDEKPTKISKVSGIPENWNRSDYNKVAFAKKSLIQLCKDAKTKYLIISYNSDGFIKKDEFIHELSKIGTLQRTVEIKYNTYRGSRNLKNRELHVNEYLFIVKKR